MGSEWDTDSPDSKYSEKTEKHSAAEIVLIIDEVDTHVAKTLNHIERNGG
jgi:hypothetical protein